MGKKEKIWLAVSYLISAAATIFLENYYNILVMLVGLASGMALYYLFFFRFLRGKVSVGMRILLFVLASAVSGMFMFASLVVGAIFVGTVFSGMFKEKNPGAFTEEKGLAAQIPEAPDAPEQKLSYYSAFGNMIIEMSNLIKGGLVLSLILTFLIKNLDFVFFGISANEISLFFFYTFLFFLFLSAFPKDTAAWVKILTAVLISLCYFYRWEDLGSLGIMLLWVVVAGLLISKLFSLKSYPELRDKPMDIKEVSKSLKKYFLVLLLHPLLAAISWISGRYIDSLGFSDAARTGIYNVANFVSSPDFTNIFLVLVVIILPIVMSLKTFGWGKGLFFGAIISLLYAGIDMGFLKQIMGCGGWCGIENAFVAFGVAIYGGVGLVIMFKNEIWPLKGDEAEVVDGSKLDK